MLPDENKTPASRTERLRLEGLLLKTMMSVLALSVVLPTGFVQCPADSSVVVRHLVDDCSRSSPAGFASNVQLHATVRWTRSIDGQSCRAVHPASGSYQCCVRYCRELGATLPCVRSARDNQEITTLTRNSYCARYNPISRPRSDTCSHIWWVGLYQSTIGFQHLATRSGWSSWAAHNCTSTYRAWAVSEPNDAGCLQENCASGAPQAGTNDTIWFDERCDISRRCVCEWPGSLSEAVETEGPTLSQLAGRPLSLSSGCVIPESYIAAAQRSFRNLIPLAIFALVGLSIASFVARQKRRAAAEQLETYPRASSYEMASGSRIGLRRTGGEAAPAAVGLSVATGHAATAGDIPVAQGRPILPPPGIPQGRAVFRPTPMPLGGEPPTRRPWERQVASAVPITPVQGVAVSGDSSAARATAGARSR